MAKQAISQMWKDPVEEDEDEFKDKELLPFFTQGDSVPPFSEWLSSWRLIADAPDFDTYQAASPRAKFARKVEAPVLLQHRLGRGQNGP